MHIGPSIYPNITRMLEQLEAYSVGLNPKFRLIMIMKPSNDFPSAISGRCFKATFEAPSGLKSKMMQLLRNNYNMIANEDTPTRTVAYAVTLLHAIISDRSKFGPIGWNVPYQYTEMEYQCSLRILKEIVARASNPHCVQCNVDDITEVEEPLDFLALQNMIGAINYEGRITDEQDRIKLKVLTESFITIEVLNPDLKFMGIKSCGLPKNPTYEEMMEQIELIVEEPTVYGLNPAQQPSASIPNDVADKVNKLYFDESAEHRRQSTTTSQQMIPLTNHPLSLVDEEIRWINKLEVKSLTQFTLLRSIDASTRVFDLRAFREPRKLFSDIRKDHAIKNGVEFEAVSLLYSFSPKEEGFGVCNLLIEAGKITNNALDDGIQGKCPILYVIPTFKKKEKQERQHLDKDPQHGQPKVRIPLYKNAMRQGDINSFG